MLADLRLVIALPLLGALAVMLAPARWGRWIGGAAAGLGLLAGALAALAAGEGLAVAWPWIPALGLSLSLAIDGLAAPGVIVICLVGQVAALAPNGTRGSIAGGLGLQAVLLALVLARDLGMLVGCHALLAPIVAALVAGGPGAGRWRAGQAAGLYLALGTAALAVAVGLLAVGHHDASGGRWTLALAEVAQVLLPRPLEAAVAGLTLLAGALTLGLWPLHGWLVAAGAAAPTGPAMLIAGPLRWVGAYVLMRMWLPLTAGSAAAAGFGVAVVAVVGAIVGVVCARAEPDGRRALLLATAAPVGLLVLGLAGQHHEGAVGAQLLAVVVALAGAAGVLLLAAGAPRRLAGLALLPAPGLAACVGAALVLIGTARFTTLTLGGHGWPLAVAGGLAIALAIRALADGTGPNEHVLRDRSEKTDARAMAMAGVLIAPLVALGVWPGLGLGRLDATGRAMIDAAALRRCLIQALDVRAPMAVPGEPIEACAQPLRALEQAAREAVEEEG